MADGEVLRAALQRGAEVGVRLMVAAAVILMFLVAGKLLRPVVRSRLAHRRRPSYARVFSGLVSVTVVLVGSLIAATIAFPSVEIADVLASLGILSVAVGFAFKDVLENLLAGVLLILRDPFQSGDEVRVGDLHGTAEGITVRETLLRTFDGRRVLVPNAQVFTNVIEVQTHYPLARSSFEVEVDVNADVSTVRHTIEELLATTDGVAAEPAPQVLAAGIGAGVRLECRYWTDSRQRDITAVRGRAVEAVSAFLAVDEVPLPASSVELLASPQLERMFRNRDGDLRQ
jgi:small-conductance mechanosensitive channel